MSSDDIVKNLSLVEAEPDAFLLYDGRQSPTAAGVQRGVCRLLADMGYTALTELPLATGRRVDIAALGPSGQIIVMEIKSSLADFRADQKWEQYLDYCDRFYFAVPPEFPREVLPGHVGLVVADRYGAEILREAGEVRLPPARRKAMTLHFARTAARRVLRLIDPPAVQ